MLLLRHFYYSQLTWVIWRYFARNFMEEMRSTGQVTGGPAPFSQTDRKEFANQLDRWLQRHHKP